MTNTQETEIPLEYPGQRAVVSDFGASLRRYARVEADGTERDVIWGYSGASNKKGGQGDVLIPFPGRVRGGEYRFEGRERRLKRNDKDGPNAIHGFVRLVPWQCVMREKSRARFRHLLSPDAAEGYPFSLETEVEYSLSEKGLRCSFAIRNTGRGSAPVGAGFHPYFVAGEGGVDGAEALIPADELVELGPDLLPTGRIVPTRGTEWDFTSWKRVSAARFNHCFAAMRRDADGLSRIGLRDPASGRGLTVWMDASFPYLVVYSGDAIPAPHARRALAIEPMTCATDALNRHEWGLRTLAPGERFSGTWGVC